MDENSAVLFDLRRTLTRLEKKLKQNQDFNAYLSLKALVEQYERHARNDEVHQEFYTKPRKSFAISNLKNNIESHKHEVVSPTNDKAHLYSNNMPTTPRSVLKEKLTQLLNQRGEPVRLTDILEYFNDTGVNVGGSDPMRNLSAKLSQMDEFESISGKGWYFKRGGQTDAFSVLD